MYQPDRGNYNKKETFGHMVTHSCLGRLIIFGALFCVLLFVAYLTVPSNETMKEEMTDNIMQCISENDSIKTDGIDAFVNNIGYIFTSCDSSEVNKEVVASFYKYNRLEIYQHTFFSTAYIHNNFRPDGTRVGFGVLGIVVPTVNFNDFLLRIGPIHKGYNQRLIRQNYERGEYFGESPDLGDY